MLQIPKLVLILWLVMSILGCSTIQSQKSTDLSTIPSECLSVCRDIPLKDADETYRTYSLELIGLYADCSIINKQCTDAISKQHKLGE